MKKELKASNNNRRIGMAIMIGLLLVAMGGTPRTGHALNLKDFFDVGSAYITHLYIHEMGHQIIADDVGAKGHEIQFLTNKGGNFYFGLSTYESIPEESKLPYAVGGDRMAGYTFEYALQSYRQKPTTYNKALLFFSGFDFLFYTLMANYSTPDDSMYDPNLIREATGCSKEVLLSMVLSKALVNAYRIYDESFRLVPSIQTTKNSAALVFTLHF